jgi:hypothetical protein
MGQKYTREQLVQAFEKVQDKKHWKNPINSFCKEEEKEITNEAIIYFTGTEAEFGKPINGVVSVTALGYYLGPCGDH